MMRTGIDHDDTNQLTDADHDYQTDESYTYDDNGNRTNGSYTVGTNNQMTSDGTHNYEYDAEGNRTKKTEISSGDYVEYEWDHRNRLTGVKFYNSSDVLQKEVAYRYDVHNKRIETKVDDDGNGTFDSTERYVRDAAGKRDGVTDVALDDVVLLFDGSNNLLSRFLHGPGIDQVLAAEDASDVIWLLADHQGSIRDAVNFDAGTGITTNTGHRKYDSFGNITSETGDLVGFLFAYASYHWDPDAEMYYVRMRWYDPATGKWVGEDPLGLHALDPNLARFVGNMPAKLTDPSGLQPPPGRVYLRRDGGAGFMNPNVDPSILDRLERSDSGARPEMGTMHLPGNPRVTGRDSLKPQTPREIVHARTIGDFDKLINGLAKKFQENPANGAQLGTAYNLIAAGVLRDLYNAADNEFGRVARLLVTRGELSLEDAARWRANKTNILRACLRIVDYLNSSRCSMR